MFPGRRIISSCWLPVDTPPPPYTTQWRVDPAGAPEFLLRDQISLAPAIILAAPIIGVCGGGGIPIMVHICLCAANHTTTCVRGGVALAETIGPARGAPALGPVLDNFASFGTPHCCLKLRRSHLLGDGSHLRLKGFKARGEQWPAHRSGHG